MNATAPGPEDPRPKSRKIVVIPGGMWNVVPAAEVPDSPPPELVATQLVRECMMDVRPWGLTRTSPFSPSSQPPYTIIGLDPVTQQAVSLGPEGQPIEAGKHGTNKETKTMQRTGGGDGATPLPSDQTTVTDYSDD